jgi:hypothetical protein
MAPSVVDIGCSQLPSRQTEWGGAEMLVACNIEPPNREERSSEWAVVSSVREIRSRSQLQSRQRKYSARETKLKSHQTEWSVVDNRL